MLGYTEAVCEVSDGQFGSANLEVPIWMDRLQCSGFEQALDHCSFSGWAENSCDHSNDAGVICLDGKNYFKSGAAIVWVRAIRAVISGFNFISTLITPRYFFHKLGPNPYHGALITVPL